MGVNEMDSVADKDYTVNMEDILLAEDAAVLAKTHGAYITEKGMYKLELSWYSRTRIRINLKYSNNDDEAGPYSLLIYTKKGMFGAYKHKMSFTSEGQDVSFMQHGDWEYAIGNYLKRSRRPAKDGNQERDLV